MSTRSLIGWFHTSSCISALVESGHYSSKHRSFLRRFEGFEEWPQRDLNVGRPLIFLQSDSLYRVDSLWQLCGSQRCFLDPVFKGLASGVSVLFEKHYLRTNMYVLRINCFIRAIGTRYRRHFHVSSVGSRPRSAVGYYDFSLVDVRPNSISMNVDKS